MIVGTAILVSLKMATRIRNTAWQTDEKLRGFLEEKVKSRYQRSELLLHVKADFAQYGWCMRTLGNRLKFFGIKYADYNTDMKDVVAAVEKEMDGPACNMGYRAMWKRVRKVHEIQVPRDYVYLAMKLVDPEGLEARDHVGKKKRPRNRRFVSEGPNYTFSLDGHDKLAGYAKSQFPLCIYGAQDCWSGKIMFLRIWTSNNKPGIIARYYYDYLCESKVLPMQLRIDRGTETDKMALVHVLCHRLIHPEEEIDEDTLIDATVKHGPSTQNKIERWWRDLHHRDEKYFKEQLRELSSTGEYDSDNQLHRDVLAYIYIDVIQKELDRFKEINWNETRGRKQRDKHLPQGIPNHLYRFPDQFNAEECGTTVTDDLLIQINDDLDVANDDHDWMSPELRAACESLLPNPGENVKPSEAAAAYIELKDAILTMDTY